VENPEMRIMGLEPENTIYTIHIFKRSVLTSEPLWFYSRLGDSINTIAKKQQAIKNKNWEMIL